LGPDLLDLIKMDLKNENKKTEIIKKVKPKMGRIKPK